MDFFAIRIQLHRAEYEFSHKPKIFGDVLRAARASLFAKEVIQNPGKTVFHANALLRNKRIPPRS
jgi:hypothetical protein